MGTRADFWVRDKLHKMTWIGSIAYDGYPEGIEDNILKSKTAPAFTKNVHTFMTARMKPCNTCKGTGNDPTGKHSICIDCPAMDATFTHEGWPWPWETSETTDYAYIFDMELKKVLISGYGGTTYTINESKRFNKIIERLEKDAEDDEDIEIPEFDEMVRDKGRHKRNIIFPDMKIVKENIFRKNKSGIMVLGDR